MPLHVMIDIAELAFEDRQTLEIVANSVFVGHAVAAVDLNRFLANQARRLANADLGCRNGTLALFFILTQLERGEIGERDRALIGGVHVHHAVLENLERADRNAELLALARIFDRLRMGDLHSANRFSALCGNRFVRHELYQGEGGAFLSDQRVCRDRDVFEVNLRCAAAIDGLIVAGDDASG